MYARGQHRSLRGGGQPQFLGDNLHSEKEKNTPTPYRSASRFGETVQGEAIEERAFDLQNCDTRLFVVFVGFLVGEGGKLEQIQQTSLAECNLHEVAFFFV